MGQPGSDLTGSTLANFLAISRMPGSLLSIRSTPKLVELEQQVIASGPQPRPSLISVAIARATTSRLARSLAFGA